jgi:hypothetical protein
VSRTTQLAGCARWSTRGYGRHVGRVGTWLDDAHTERVPAPLASNFLMPNETFFVLLLVSFAVFGLLVVWPFVETVVRQQWGYMLGVVLLGPIGGLLWFLVGRRETTQKMQRSEQSRMRATHSV